MELILLGFAGGAIIAYFILQKFSAPSRKDVTHKQSAILLEKIRSVCNVITVEGDFSEIYHYENIQKKWLNLLLGKKKALLLVDAKAHVGFDLTKIKMEANEVSKTIIITGFPQPELLSIDTNFRYYDKKEGWANPFTAADLTDITSEAKNYIVDKVPSSGLYIEASKLALETLELISQLAATIEWKVDYTALSLPEPPSKNVLLEN
jgi:hypothetical protein